LLITPPPRDCDAAFEAMLPDIMALLCSLVFLPDIFTTPLTLMLRAHHHYIPPITRCLMPLPPMRVDVHDAICCFCLC